MITCSVLADESEVEFFVSFVYASNFVEERQELWEDIKYHHDSPLFRGKPWLIMGDFNESLDGMEHSTFDENPFIPQGMRDFQNTVRYGSLADMGYHGPLFTWCNKRNEGLICKKLDRVLVNEEWNRKFPLSYSKFESGGCSDHLRCRIKVGDDRPRPRGPFKFSNILISSPEFMPLVETYWASTPTLFHSTSAMFRFSKKLKALKPIIKTLSRNKLSHLSTRVHEAHTVLCEKHKATLNDPSSEAILDETQAYTTWEKLADLEEGFLKQKSKLHWLQVGDKNNKFFHNSAKSRISTNAIRELLSSNGRVCTSPAEIKSEAVSFFESFLTEQPDDFQNSTVSHLQELMQYICSTADHTMLMKEVTDTEIQKILFQCQVTNHRVRMASRLNSLKRHGQFWERISLWQFSLSS